MKNNLIRFILIILVMFFVSTCSTDEEIAVSTETCAASSSGSGPTIGNYTLQEANYVSNCFQSKKMSMEFKNNSVVLLNFNSYSDSSCAGSGTSFQELCFDPLTATSTTSTQYTYDPDADDLIGENVTGYYTTGVDRINSSYTMHFNIAPESNSVFWIMWSDSKSELDASDSLYIFKLTKE
ncbi:MAG: hypothetical protein ACKVHI_04585 [Candidatus Puniceispirillales bacterium]